MYVVPKRTVVKCLACLIALILLVNNSFAEPIKVRLSDESFPVSYKGEKGWEGMDVDIFKALFQQAGLDFVFVEMPFKRSLREIKKGVIQVMPNLRKNDQRSEFLHWIGPVRLAATALIVKKNNVSLPIVKDDDLIDVATKNGKKFGFIYGANYADAFDQRVKNDAQFNSIFLFVAKGVLNHKMLHRDRIIGFFHDDFEAYNIIETLRKEDSLSPTEVYFREFAVHPFRIKGSKAGAYIGLSKELDLGTVERIKSAYNKMVRNGTFEQIHIAWTGQKLSSELLDLQTK